MIDMVEQGTGSSDLQARLSERQAHKEQLLVRIQDLERAHDPSVRLPDEAWIRRQLAELGEAIRRDPAAVGVIRRLLGRIDAQEMITPGKKRGYMRLRFALDKVGAVVHVAAGHLPAALTEQAVEMPGDQEALCEVFVVDLGTPTAMDRWVPEIVRWRQQGLGWAEIGRRSGLQPTNASTAYQRFIKGGGQGV